MADKVDSSVKGFLDSVKKNQSPEEFRVYLTHCPRDGVLKWRDENQLDLLHHCILADSPEAVNYLLNNGYFLEPHTPEVSPYLHLAAKLGHRTVINMLLNQRPHDNCLSDLSLYPDDNGQNNGKKLMPVDVAANSGHTNCVHFLLSQTIVKAHPDHEKSPYIVLATIADSPLAVKLLLKDKPKSSDIDAAVTTAVRGARSECLDVLLGTGHKTHKLFDGVNLYHALYTHSSTMYFEKDRYENMADVTAVLIKHKHDVESRTPSNTYPLYSCLYNAISVHNYQYSKQYLRCVRLLLGENADPNFDEYKFEFSQIKGGKKSVKGRCSYSSAIHCLLDTSETHFDAFDSKDDAYRFITDFADALAQHGANCNQVGRLGDQKSQVAGTVLHQFAKTSAEISVGHDLLKFMLRSGCDPDIGVKGKYAINTFADFAFAKLNSLKPTDKGPNLRDEIMVLLQMCDHMTRAKILECLKVFKKDHDRNPPPRIKPYVDLIIKELEGRTRSILPLKRLVADVIWKLCRRDPRTVHKLSVSPKVKTQILPIQ
ncbi:hypothetical protein FSP39_025189 [Pinctada imbricata]|uniref:Uncharacterized protein n=1 Tax=Pinctada imbricata TaxID=66713 RepID=A0AA88XXC5_PINIB|nr:hypothetical protein FSP39_025189 [Pinctada imbricata]